LPSLYKQSFIKIPSVVLKLLAGQGAESMDGRRDGQSGDYMLPPFWGA